MGVGVGTGVGVGVGVGTGVGGVETTGISLARYDVRLIPKPATAMAVATMRTMKTTVPVFAIFFSEYWCGIRGLARKAHMFYENKFTSTHLGCRFFIDIYIFFGYTRICV
jgi:hypothetical protein